MEAPKKKDHLLLHLPPNGDSPVPRAMTQMRWPTEASGHNAEVLVPLRRWVGSLVHQTRPQEDVNVKF